MGFYFRSLFVVNFFHFPRVCHSKPVFPYLRQGYGFHRLHFAAIFSVFTIAKMALSPWIGFCSDRVRRRSFIAIGLGLYACVALLYLCPPGVPLSIVARFPQGVATAFFRTVIMEFKGLSVVFYCSGIIGIAGVIIFYICSNSHNSKSAC